MVMVTMLVLVHCRSSRIRHPDGGGLDVPSPEQSPPKEAKKEAPQSSSDSAPKIGIVEELPASKCGVVYVHVQFIIAI